MEKESSFFTYNGLTTDGRYIWYITERDQLLMQIDSKNNDVTCLGFIPGAFDRPNAFRRLFYIEGKLILIPYLVNWICVYDFENHSFEKVNISDDQDDLAKLFDAVPYGDNLILYGVKSEIVKLNIKTMEISKTEIDSDKVKAEMGIDVTFWKDGIIAGDKLMLPIPHYPVVFIMDLKTETYELKKVANSLDYVPYRFFRKNERNTIYDITERYNGEIEIKELDIDCLNVQGNYTVKLDIEKVDETDIGEIPFLSAESIDDRIFFAAGRQRKSFLVNIKTSETKELDVPCTEIDILRKRGGASSYNYFDTLGLDNGRIALLNCEKRVISYVDGENGELIKSFALELPVFDRDEVYNQNQLKARSVNETNIFCLSSFLKYVEKGRD